MELYDQIRKISFIFFAIIGLAHFLAGFFYINGYLLPQSGLANRVLFIPFVLAGMTYVLSNIKFYLAQYNKDSKASSIAVIALGSVVFLGLLAIEIFVLDSTTPLSPSQSL